MTSNGRLGDALVSRSPKSAADGAFAALDGIQQLPHPADQVLGLALAFKATCEVLEVDPDYLMRIVSRMEQDCRFRDVNTLSAVRAYVAGELKKKLP